MTQVGAGVGAVEYVQFHWMLVGVPATTDDGIATNAEIAGATGAATAVMETSLVAVPAELVHVSVNTASLDRVTLVVAPEVTVPTLRLMEHVGAGTGVLLYDQVQVTSVGLPITTAVGLAE